MADNLEPKKLEESLALLKKIAKMNEDLKESDAAAAVRATQYLENLKRTNDQLEVSIARYESQIKAKEKILETDKSQEELIKKEISAIEQKIELHKKSAEVYKKNQKEIEKALEQSLTKREKFHKDYVKSIAKGEDKLWKIANANMQDSKKGIREYVNDSGNMLKSMGNAFTLSMDAAYKDIDSLATLAPFSGLMTPLDKLQENILSIPGGIDKSFRGIIKNVGFGAEELRNSFVYMFDPIYAASTNKAFKNLEKEARPLANIGLQLSDVGEAMEALINDVAMFRPEFIKNNEVASTFTGNLIAGLKKLGVPLKTSAKSLNLFTKAMKFTPKQATNSLKSLANVSKSLGLSMNQVFTGFDAVSPKLVQFGDRTVEVFANLQAMAQGTGVEVGKLAGYAEKLDTFKGAATAAQQLNAVLGSTVVSVTDLVHADPADKFRIIQDAVANAGLDFETADRRMKQVIATAAGMSVPDFSKMVLNQDEAAEAAAAMDTTVMSQEELKAKIDETMTNMELMQKNLSSLGGGFDRFLQRTREGATKASDIMIGAIGGVQEDLKDSEQTAISISTLIAGTKGAIDALPNTLKSLTPLIPVLGALYKEFVDTETPGDQSAVNIKLPPGGKKPLRQELQTASTKLPADKGPTELRQAQAVTAMRAQKAAAEGEGVTIAPGAEVTFNVASTVKLDNETVGKIITPVVLENTKGRLQVRV
jgi:hypothetical protein